MDTIEITLKLPADYVRDAQDFDMLNPDTILAVLRQELDNRIMAFVDAEVKAYRAEKRAEQNNQTQSS
ncbi:MAG: hypothetical protein CUN52_10280 [Phototrophicales bacterium]|nr:MAG: hypothetical protein CUN52_10280 [Phototrophicales bacterium]